MGNITSPLSMRFTEITPIISSGRLPECIELLDNLLVQMYKKNYPTTIAHFQNTADHPNCISTFKR